MSTLPRPTTAMRDMGPPSWRGTNEEGGGSHPHPRELIAGVRLQHLHPGDLLALAVHGVDGAGEARVERVDRAERLERQLRIRDGVADQRLLVRAEVLVVG